MGALCKEGMAKPLSSLFPNIWAALRVGRGEFVYSRAGAEQVTAGQQH